MSKVKSIKKDADKTLPGTLVVDEVNFFDKLGRYAPLLTLVLVMVGGGLKYFMLEKPRSDIMRAQNARELDRLLEEVVPHIEVKITGDPIWSEEGVTIPAQVRNKGERSVRAQVFVDLDGGGGAGAPSSGDFRYTTCEIKYLKMGEAVDCNLNISAHGEFSKFSYVWYKIKVNARTDIDENLFVNRELRKLYPADLLDTKSARYSESRGSASR